MHLFREVMMCENVFKKFGNFKGFYDILLDDDVSNYFIIFIKMYPTIQFIIHDIENKFFIYDTRHDSTTMVVVVRKKGNLFSLFPYLSHQLTNQYIPGS